MRPAVFANPTTSDPSPPLSGTLTRDKAPDNVEPLQRNVCTWEFLSLSLVTRTSNTEVDMEFCHQLLCIVFTYIPFAPDRHDLVVAIARPRLQNGLAIFYDYCWRNFFACMLTARESWSILHGWRSGQRSDVRHFLGSCTTPRSISCLLQNISFSALAAALYM